VGKFNVLGADPEELFELWEWARREHGAANALLLTGDRGHGRSVALHLFRGWHALASMFARKTDLPEPELESFTLERESVILAPISSRGFSNWTSSFDSIRDTALRGPWYSGSPEPDERHLRRQARFLGRCLKAHHPRDARIPWRSRSLRVGRRKVLTAMAVLVLVVAAFDLGKRLWVSFQRTAEAEDVAPSIPWDVDLMLEEVSDPKPRGYAWNGPGTVRFKFRVYISLGGIVHPESVTVSLDANDSYLFSLMAGDEHVGFLELGPTWIGGLDVYDVTIPRDAISYGFDSIVIEAEAGDGDYALGHLLLGPTKDEASSAAAGPG